MTVRHAIRASLALLSRRDRRLLGLVTLAQMSTAFLDLLGVLLIGVVAALSVSVVSNSPPPAMIQTVVDLFGMESLDTVTVAGVLAVSAGVVLITKTILSVFLTRRVLRFLANRQAIVSGRLAAGLLSQPLLAVQQRSSQETAYALTTGVGLATLLVLGQGVVAVTEIALLIVLAVGLIVVAPLVTVFTIIFFALVAFLLQRLMAVWAGKLGGRLSDADIASYTSVQEALSTYREVTVTNRRGLYVQRFQGLRWQAASVQADLQFMSLIPKYVFEIALVVGAGLLAVSQLLTKDLAAATAMIAVFLAAGSRIVPSMLRLQGAALAIRVSAGGAAVTLALADELAARASASVTVSHFGFADVQTLTDRLERGYPDFEPSIQVSHAWLTYPGTDAPALADVSLSLQSGSSLALVGPTGAGKSTLADVILGVLHIEQGEVRMSGISPAEAITRWPGGLAYVPQEVAMASGTIRENVALGLPRAAVDDDRVWEALDRAHLADFLRESREGLETIIGEHGIKLSGGQRQRLGVARALYTRPKLLVLDEATSALDAETEQSIVDTLRDLAGHVTTVTIAHRLATIRNCDQIVYLEAGHVLACGTFDEVRNAAPNFDRQATLLGL